MFVNCLGSPLGCDSDTRACGPPRRGRPAAFKFDSDELERAGGEEAAARATTYQARTCPANRPTSSNPPPPSLSSIPPTTARREGVLYQGRLQVRVRPRRRDAQICNKGDGPTATRSCACACTCQICLGGYVFIRNKTL